MRYNDVMKQKELTVGHFPIVDHLILGVSRKHDDGFFQNFELKMVEYQRWKNMCDDLLAARLDGTFMLFPLAMDLYRNGAPIRIVLLGQREGQVIVLGNGVKNIADLKGKTVWLPSLYSVHNILLHQALKTAGLADSDVTRTIGSIDIHEIPQLLKEKKFDGFVSAEPWGTIAVKMKAGKIAAISQEIKTHHICCVLVLRDEVIKARPDACNELIDSLVKAGMFINAYPRQAAEIGEAFMGCSRKIALEALTHDRGHVLFWDLLPRREDFEELQQIAVQEMRVWDTSLRIEELLYADFAQAAYRRWMIDVRREVKDRGSGRTLPGTFVEAVERTSAFFHTPIQALGVTFIEHGEKYPKNTRQRKVPIISFSILEEALSGKSFTVERASENMKGLVCFTTLQNIEPDRVLLRLSEERAQQCHRALRFGVNTFQIGQAIDGDLTPWLTGQTESGALRHGKDIWVLLDHTAFRFLPLLLCYF